MKRPDYPEESWEMEAMRGIARLYGAMGMLVFVAGVVWALWFS